MRDASAHGIDGPLISAELGRYISIGLVVANFAVLVLAIAVYCWIDGDDSL